MRTACAAVSALFLCGILAFTIAATNAGESAPETSRSGIPVGAKCQIVLDGASLNAYEGYVTPRHTDGNINGSKDSVWGRLVSFGEDWVVVRLAKVRVEEKNGSVKTSGTAGIQQQYKYWIPRSNIAYVRTWKD